MRTSQTAVQNADRKEADAAKQLQWVESLRTESAEARAALARLQLVTDEKEARILQLSNDAEGAWPGLREAPSCCVAETRRENLVSLQVSVSSLSQRARRWW
jgi:hypothetical protein